MSHGQLAVSETKNIRLELTRRNYEYVLFGETALPVVYSVPSEPIRCHRDLAVACT